MKAYLVGGAVRDQLLGYPVTERDWLVIGATAEELLALGYRPVGREFPIFLHPVTHEEYALPRAPVMSGDDRLIMEQDLLRRDLTINALAMSPEGELIDPLGGAADLRAGILRHTPAFREDPIRILRLARFAARYAGRGFQVAHETRELVQRMAGNGALSELVPERVWAEIEKAMEGEMPRVFIQTLRELGALGLILPELERLFGVPQPARYHPEIDTGEHSLLALERACDLSPLGEVRFSALVHDVGKGLTPPGEWPRHIGHEARGARLVGALCQRLRVPNRYRRLAEKVARFHTDCHRALELRSTTLLKRLRVLDALRQPQQLEPFLAACEADFRGRPGFESLPYPQADFLRAARNAALTVDAASLAREEKNKAHLTRRIERARIQAIAGIDRRAFRSI